MSDTVEAVHPVPVLSRPRRGRHAGWTLVAARTPVALPEVAPGDVHGVADVLLEDRDEAPVPLVLIEGRAFVEVGPRGGRAPTALPDLLASPGGGYRNLEAGAILLAGTPASAVHPGLGPDLSYVQGTYEDHRGLDPDALGRQEIVEDLTEPCRRALRAFVARNVRIAGGKAYVDAGGPLLAPVQNRAGFAFRHAPRGLAGHSLVRLARPDLPAYCEAMGLDLPPIMPGPLSAVPDRPGGEADLCFLNAAPGAMLSDAAPHLRRARREAGAVPEEAVAAFEALRRPAMLGAVGLVDPEDAVAVLEAVGRAAAWFSELPLPGGLRRDQREAAEAQVRGIARDLDRWALPRARAHQARFDDADAGYLPGPRQGR